MSRYFLRMTLESDTTFGRGDGIAGYIDAEVEHDEYGLPFLRGRALKGLLVEECANILFSLRQAKPADYQVWENTADRLFGCAGSDLRADAQMQVGDAALPEDLRGAVRFEIERQGSKTTSDEVLQSLTAIRRQTAMKEDGAPRKESLRSMRVVLRQTVFESDLSFDFTPVNDSDEIILLAACASAVRRVGLGRNRGRGRVSLDLFENDNNLTARGWQKFREKITSSEAAK